MFQIRKVRRNMPPRVVIYGEAGVGKTSFGVNGEKPILISLEDGGGRAKRFDGQEFEEFPKPNNWGELRAMVKQLMDEKKYDYKTLVLDTADKIDELCQKQLIGNTDKTLATISGGYGAGYEAAKKLHVELIEDLDKLREKGMTIVVTAHADVKASNEPDLPEAFDMIVMKCDKKINALWREWCDALFFVKKNILLKTDPKKKARAVTDGTRVIYTTRQPAFHAKNGYGMPDEMEFTEDFYKTFMSYVSKPNEAKKSETTLGEIKLLLAKVDEATRNLAQMTLDKNPNQATLEAMLKRLKEVTNEH